METLSNNFNNLLVKYTDTYQKFLNVINSGDGSSLTTVPNSAFIGESNINTIQGSSVDNCLSECNSNDKCTGATFDTNLKTCILNSGTGNILNSKDQIAIVKQALYYTNELQQINNNLIENTIIKNINQVESFEFLRKEYISNEEISKLMTSPMRHYSCGSAGHQQFNQSIHQSIDSFHPSIHPFNHKVSPFTL